MRISTWFRFFKQGMHNIIRNRVMSFASIVAIMSSLFILGVVLVIVFNLNYMVEGIESKVEISVFLEKDISQDEIQSIKNQMETWKDVYEVEFISKEQALEQWKKELGDKASLLEGYTEENNPLPDKLLLRIEKPEYAEGVLSNIKKIQKIEKINYSREVADIISKVVSITRLIGFSISALLALIATVIINNTIKMAVYSRRREINIMKYIGATDWYIRWPFIIEGFVLGNLGAILACSLLAGGYYLILENSTDMISGLNFLNAFKLLPIEAMFYDIGLIFFVVASIVGVFASILSTYKHLRV